MKKIFGVTVGMLVLATLAIVIVPSSRDEIHWRLACHKDETASYEGYVKVWPVGRHATEAQARYDEYEWADTLANKKLFDLERYIENHPEGKHVNEARNCIESLNWQAVTATKTGSGFKRYIQLHPDGKHVNEAKDCIEILDWQEAAAAKMVPGFVRYIQLHPDGKHVTEAKDIIESLHWREAIASETVSGFVRYTQLHPDGKHVTESKDRVESLYWQKAADAKTIRSYQNYTSAYPNGRFSTEANSKASALVTDDTPFIEAVKAGTEYALRHFVEEFPGHRNQLDAARAIKDITEGRDIVDLLREKKIEIETSGSGIQNVDVRIRKLMPYNITVRVPIGSYFVSARQSAQNMVTTEERKLQIIGDDWNRLLVPAACANRPRKIPDHDDTFTVERLPYQEDLAKLMLALNKVGVNYATQQAAVWIVTDDASYSNLGILVSQGSFGAINGIRTIRELETVRAMKICEEAGIDITKKRIWSDSQILLQELPDGDVKTWLQTKVNVMNGAGLKIH